MAGKHEGSGEKTLYCSFCGKSQHEVRKLIAGPSVFICDECIELCNDIVKDARKPIFPAPQRPHRFGQDPAGADPGAPPERALCHGRCHDAHGSRLCR